MLYTFDSIVPPMGASAYVPDQNYLTFDNWLAIVRTFPVPISWCFCCVTCAASMLRPSRDCRLQFLDAVTLSAAVRPMRLGITAACTA